MNNSETEAKMDDLQVLQELTECVNTHENLSDRAKSEYTALVKRFRDDGLVIVMPLDIVDDMQERALRDLKREGFLNLNVKHVPGEGHSMYITLAGERFRIFPRGKQEMLDSGQRQSFETGAVRDTAEGKPRPDLISPFAMERLGEWLRLGAEKYTPRNWEKGIPISRSLASLYRHLLKYQQGATDEDHMAAIMCNAMFIIHTEDMVRRGQLPESLADMPNYIPNTEEQHD